MDDCILWWGRIQPNGYGVLGRWEAGRARTIYAHRMVYEECFGEIPDGMQIDHLCRVRSCVNPAHLEVVTPRENNLRNQSPAAISYRTNHCYQGHPYTPESTYVWNGRRYCRICRAQYAHRRRAA